MRIRLGLGNERGASVVILAVSLFAMLGMAALAVDIGMLLKVRTDAQRAADAAALAGAAEFLNGDPILMREEAADSAWKYAGRNYVGWQGIDTTGPIVTDSGTRRIINTPEAYIQSIPDSQKVRVWIRRAGEPTWFGNLLGVDRVTVTGRAVAQAVNAGTGKCVKPFAMADIWDDVDDDIDPVNELEDIGPGQGPNSGETWDWNKTDGDHYRRWQDSRPEATGIETGYGSAHRNNSVAKEDLATGTKYWNDYGRPIVLKKSNPQQTAAPGFFQPWVLPGTEPGAQGYRANISGCNPNPIMVNAEYSLDPTADNSAYDNKPGNMIGPTKQGMDDLIDLDPDACWAETADPNHSGWTSGEVRKRDPNNANDKTNCTVAYPNWESSPRVAIVPLFDPEQLGTGRTQLKFNNLALIFVEDQKTRHEPVVARFLYFAKSTGPTAPTTGSLIKKLQLIE
jgi:hypothetical protein